MGFKHFLIFFINLIGVISVCDEGFAGNGWYQPEMNFVIGGKDCRGETGRYTDDEEKIRDELKKMGYV